MPAADTWAASNAQDGDQTIMTNDSGRAVLIVSKKSQKTDEFEERRRELKSTPASEDDGGLPTPSAELPEPAGNMED